jgi:hypothetical protein
MKSRCPRSTRADTLPFSELRLASPDWHSPSVSLVHRPRPDYDPVWVPASLPPPAHARYACCAVWKAGCASPCRRSSFHHAESAVTDGFRIEGNRETSPISSAQVRAVIGPTPGTVLSRLIRSASRGSRCSELTRAYSVFCNRTMVSRLTRSNGRMLSCTSSLAESSSRK